MTYKREEIGYGHKKHLRNSNFQGLTFALMIVLAYLAAQPILINNGTKTINEALIPMFLGIAVTIGTSFLYLKDKNNYFIRWFIFAVIEGGYSYLMLTSNASTASMLIFPISLVFLFYMDKHLSVTVAIVNIVWSIYAVMFKYTNNDTVSNAILVLSTIAFFIGIIAITYSNNKLTDRLVKNNERIKADSEYQNNLIEQVKMQN